MKESTVTIRIDAELKRRVMGKARARGTTLSFVIVKALRLYLRGELSIEGKRGRDKRVS